MIRSSPGSPSPRLDAPGTHIHPFGGRDPHASRGLDRCARRARRRHARRRPGPALTDHGDQRLRPLRERPRPSRGADAERESPAGGEHAGQPAQRVRSDRCRAGSESPRSRWGSSRSRSRLATTETPRGSSTISRTTSASSTSSRINVKATLRVGDEPNDVVFAGRRRRLRERLAGGPDARLRSREPRGCPGQHSDRRAACRVRSRAAPRVAGVRRRVLRRQSHRPCSPRRRCRTTRCLRIRTYPARARARRPRAAPDRTDREAGCRRETGATCTESCGTPKVPYSIREVDVAEILDRDQHGDAQLRRSRRGELRARGESHRRPRRVDQPRRPRTSAARAAAERPHGGHADRLRDPGAGAQTVRNLNPRIDYGSLDRHARRSATRRSACPPAWRFPRTAGVPTSPRSRATSSAVIDPDGGSVGTVLARVPTVAGPTRRGGRRCARPASTWSGRFRNQLQTLSTSDFSRPRGRRDRLRSDAGRDRERRQFFYGGFTSGHGDQSCASCHVFGDLDNLAWDLGDPTGDFQPPPSGQARSGARRLRSREGPDDDADACAGCPAPASSTGAAIAPISPPSTCIRRA